MHCKAADFHQDLKRASTVQYGAHSQMPVHADAAVCHLQTWALGSHMHLHNLTKIKIRHWRKKRPKKWPGGNPPERLQISDASEY